MLSPAPRISVIIPCYNHANILSKCLRSLLAQTFLDFEVIAVNDDSTDGTVNVLDKWQWEFSKRKIRFKVINQPKRKIGDDSRRANIARNCGARFARADFLLFLDADIIMKKEMLAKMLVALEQNPTVSYVYAAHYFGYKKFKLWPFDKEKLKKMNYIHTSSLIRKERFPGFDENIAKLQDWDLWLTMLAKNHIGKWIPKVLFTVIPRKNGISNWLPSFVYKIPWQKIGIKIERLEQYQWAESVIRKKHGI